MKITDNYDAVVVLGKEPKPDRNGEWKFESQILDCLETAATTLRAGKVKKIIVSGHSAPSVTATQPWAEADEMARILRDEHGVADADILREDKSHDTIENLFFTKTRFCEPNNFRKILFIVADWRVMRLYYLVAKIFGADYDVDIYGVASEEDPKIQNEIRAFMYTTAWLSDLTPGDDAWLPENSAQTFSDLCTRQELGEPILVKVRQPF